VHVTFHVTAINKSDVNNVVTYDNCKLQLVLTLRELLTLVSDFVTNKTYIWWVTLLKVGRRHHKDK